MMLSDERLADLYRQYGPVVYRRALAILADEEDAREAVQDVFLTVQRKWSSFRGESSPMTWIYRVATNHCLNRIRARRTRARAMSELRERESDSRLPDPAAAVERRELVGRLLRHFDTRKVQILVHRFYDDMTQEEIGRVLGISERAVRKALKKIMEEARIQVGVLTSTLREES